MYCNITANFIIRISHQKSATLSFGHICIRRHSQSNVYAKIGHSKLSFDIYQIEIKMD